MDKNISFKNKHKKIEILKGSEIIDTLTVNEFKNLHSKFEIFIANNPVLFEDNLDIISSDSLNYEKFGDGMTIGDDFSDGLLALNIRALYFYKKDYTYLFYDFIYNTEDNLHSQKGDYGVGNYNLVTTDVISMNIEKHDKSLIKTGYITNAYIKGHLGVELRKILKNLNNVRIMINGMDIDRTTFWNDSTLVEYDSLLLSNI